ncbi:unnamed protein product [Sordaria macrospora k-hell]|uniref:WGS project CABT00000000 data, contig 2.9 n=1 Tax=Sordaria macrospora (strain ATCC MYA-333 / DSM 997 / K(L3346) / K-hell) TaxID=771870 RepID=F7VVI0_SORMK|nr:uncharacterized protein SMAC_03552 [Sordaria macrospora k-hell]CCC09521.1 unnamed protein product [Sordaria macrospora k-hell]
MQLLATGLLGYIIPLLCLLGLCHAIEPTTDCPSDGDPCLQGVTDPYWGPAFTDRTANAKADCSRFQEDTLYGHTARTRVKTLTLTVRPTITTTTALETYYPEDTITATTETTSTESYSPNYTPSTPFSYTPCAFDPLNGGLFDLLGPNGQIVVKSRYDPNGKAVEFRAGVSEGDGNSDSENFPGYRFYSPPNATTNVFDIIIPAGPATGTGTGKEKTKYLAVFSSGAVGFVDRSSNGQTYVPSPSSSTDGGSDGEGGQYVTTIWSVQCNGFATAGILGGIRFDFGIRDNGELTVGSYRAGRRGRSQRKDRRQSPLQSVPGGFWIIPKAGVVPPVGDIPSGEGEGGACMEPEEKVKKVESASSQCGSEDWREYFVPKFDFEDECRFLHKCWATCTQTMTSCNEAFLSLLLGTCDSSIPSTSSSPSNSPSSPSTLSSPSPSNGGLTDTTNLTACHNLAHFTHYYLSSTPHAFAVYASVYSQVCVVTDDSVVSSTSSTSSTTSNTCTLYGPDTPPTSGSGDSNNNNTSTTDNPNYYCSGTVSHPYMTSCPIGTSTSPTKKGRE